MHQNRWRLGLRPRPHCESLQRSPRPLAGFKEPTLRPLLLRKKEERGGEREGSVTKMIYVPLAPPLIFMYKPAAMQYLAVTVAS